METRLLKYFSVLAKELYVGLSPRCSPAIRNSIISICNKAGFFPNVVHGVSQINSIVKLVEKNLGYSIIPSGIKEAFKQKIKFFELDDYPERAELSLAYNPKQIDETSMKVVDLVLNQDY